MPSRVTKATLVETIRRTACILDAWAITPPNRSRDWKRAFTEHAAWMRAQARITTK